MSYLFRLADRLSAGLAEMDIERKQRHRNFLLSQQTPEGGFRGREGDADLYYTGFAVRSLAILDQLSPEVAESVSGFLRQQSVERLNTVDLLSWVYSALVTQAAGGQDVTEALPPNWVDEALGRLERLRRDDGGYAKNAEGAISSTYHSFLVSLIYEMLSRSIPQPDQLVQFIFDRQRDDGGFVEIAPMKRSGTNPTAAAVALLRMLGALDPTAKQDVAGFLGDVRSSEGGFQANTRIPFADGLSTFTGLLTAQEIGADDLLDSAKCRQFLTEWLEFPTGGFRGASWDEQADAEYTFYGLGTLGLMRYSQ